MGKDTDKKTYVDVARNRYTNRYAKSMNRRSYSMHNHTDPRRNANIDHEGFTKVSNMKGSTPVRQSFAGSRQPNRYVPNFYGYYYRCNKFDHRMSDCRKMNVNPSFESRNSFFALQSINIMCYNCNKLGHKSYECRSNMQMCYNNVLSTSFGAKGKCYKCQNFGHIARHYQLRTDK